MTSLHVGEVNIRVGYVPFNTDVYQSFDMDMYDDVESVIQGIGGYISSRPRTMLFELEGHFCEHVYGYW